MNTSFGSPADGLACPVCGTTLNASPPGLNCKHGHSFPLDNGVIDFRIASGSHYSNPLSPRKMQEVNAQLATDGWTKALGDFLELAGDVSRWRHEIFDEGRYAWKIFLSLRPGRKLVNFGCGLGSSVQHFSPHFAKTYAIDSTYENAVFTRRRLDRFNASDDVTVIAGTGLDSLPFENSSIDVAMVNSSMESMGDSQYSGNASGSGEQNYSNGILCSPANNTPRERQLFFLREISRILKPDGELFIRGNNLFDYQHMTSGSGDQGKEPTRPLLPQVVSKISCLLRPAKRQSNTSYTISGYRHLLHEAGLPNVDVVAFHQDGDLSEEIRPGPGNFPLWSPPAPGHWKNRIKQHPWLAPSYGLIARKLPDRNPSLEELVATEITQKFDAGVNSFQTMHYSVSQKGKLIVHASCKGNELYVRFPMSENAYLAETRNHSRLEWLQSNRRELSTCFPRPIYCGQVTKQPVFAESAVHGQSILSMLKRQGDASESIRVALAFLGKLNTSSMLQPVQLSSEVYQRIVTEPVRRLSNLLSAGDLENLLLYFQRQLEDKAAPLGLQHGDYSARNILVEDGEVSGLLDWEESIPDGIPALDAIGLVFSCYRRIRGRVEGGESLVALARRRSDLKEYLDALDGFYERNQVDNSLHEPLVFLYWIHSLSHHIESGRILAQNDIGRFVVRFVKAIIDENRTELS